MLEEEVKRALRVLQQGGTILYPTDTIWGIGCDATNGEAVAKVQAIKKRETTKSMIVLVDTKYRLKQIIPNISNNVLTLTKIFKKPLTLVLSNSQNLPPNILAQDNTIGIRITKDPFCKELIKALDSPIISTSANISGSPSPLCFDEISSEIIASVDYVVQFKRNKKAKYGASTIVKISEDYTQMEILRI